MFVPEEDRTNSPLEILHTVSIVQEMFDTYVASRDEVSYDEEMRKAAEEVSDTLYSFYTLCGHKWLNRIISDQSLCEAVHKNEADHILSEENSKIDKPE